MPVIYWTYRDYLPIISVQFRNLLQYSSDHCYSTFKVSRVLQSIEVHLEGYASLNSLHKLFRESQKRSNGSFERLYYEEFVFLVYIRYQFWPSDSHIVFIINFTCWKNKTKSNSHLASSGQEYEQIVTTVSAIINTIEFPIKHCRNIKAEIICLSSQALSVNVLYLFTGEETSWSPQQETNCTFVIFRKINKTVLYMYFKIIFWI